MYTKATLVARPTMPAPKNQTHEGIPPAPVAPTVCIMCHVTNARAAADRIVVAQ